MIPSEGTLLSPTQTAVHRNWSARIRPSCRQQAGGHKDSQMGSNENMEPVLSSSTRSFEDPCSYDLSQNIMDSYSKRRSFGSYFGLSFKTLQLSLHFWYAVDGKALPSSLFTYNINQKQAPKFKKKIKNKSSKTYAPHSTFRERMLSTPHSMMFWQAEVNSRRFPWKFSWS